MTGSQPLHLHVEFDRDASPVRGRVTGQGDERAFTGWTELFAVLQSAVADDGAALQRSRTTTTKE